MFRTIFEKIFGSRQSMPIKKPYEWHGTVEKIRAHIGNHSIYLELPGGGWCKLEEANESTAATGVAVAYVAEGVEPWDTEAPARHMAQTLSALIGKELPYYLSRDFTGFVGYYVYINS
ncbi:hypothetical protein [Microbulbifer marinus]|uniref:hypothetical protein n=1 Tax=Microbulbifer marinus TaxID=658218 RepID=UPI0011153F2D|nr:hypothetical protein [Microbulbifer marinus]